VCLCVREREGDGERARDCSQKLQYTQTNCHAKSGRLASPLDPLLPPLYVCTGCTWCDSFAFITIFAPLCTLSFFFAYLWGLSARWQPWQPNALVNKFSTLLSVRDATLKCLQLVAMQRKNAIKT